MEIPDSHTKNPNIQDKSTTLRNPDTKINILAEKPVAVISKDQIQSMEETTSNYPIKRNKRITELVTPRRRSARLTERLQSQSDSEQDLPTPKVEARVNRRRKKIETDQSRPAENPEKTVLPVDQIDYPIQAEIVNIVHTEEIPAKDKAEVSEDLEENVSEKAEMEVCEPKPYSGDEVGCIDQAAEQKSNEISKIAHQPNEDVNSAGKESLLAEIGPSILNSSDKESDIVSGKNHTKGISSSIDKENSTEGYPKETSMADDRKLKHSRDMALGRNKSGRFWKSQRDRFKANIKVKGLHQVSAQKRIAQKEQLLRVKAYEKSLKDDVKRSREEKRQRAEENKKRRDENDKKNETVQVIKNPAKMKRMKKKQLRMLAKRDVTIV